jgi:hypothetical protein
VTSEEKIIIRKALRTAIKIQNEKVLFSCRDCCFYGDVCELDPRNRLIHSLRQPTQLPECFSFSVIDSAFAGVLELMDAMNIDFHSIKHGWPTVVGRLAARANRFGYILPMRLRNLERYG